MSELLIGDGTQVTLHFALKLEDGTVVDSTFDATPATFQVGDESLLEGFERSLFGLSAGERAELRLPAERAFGEPNPRNVHRMLRSELPAEPEPEPGLVFAFRDGGGSELPAVVTEVDGGMVTVDFNHPLAGRTIMFEVQILEVRHVR